MGLGPTAGPRGRTNFTVCCSVAATSCCDVGVQGFVKGDVEFKVNETVCLAPSSPGEDPHVARVAAVFQEPRHAQPTHNRTSLLPLEPLDLYNLCIHHLY